MSLIPAPRTFADDLFATSGEGWLDADMSGTGTFGGAGGSGHKGHSGHASAVIFLTGLSASGKSTLASGLEARLQDAGIASTIIDGDVLRAGVSKDLGFSDADRRENLRRATTLALELAAIGKVVIVALIAPFREERAATEARVRAAGIPFAEIFVNAPLSACERRDPKGLYRKARAGKIPSFTGIDSPYEAPLAPAMELRTDLESVEQSLSKLTQLALQLSCVAPAHHGASAAEKRS